MIGASLLLALQLVAQSSASANPQVLLEQLGAARYADREAAARALESLGREAIPVLQNARESRDMEIRTRSVALLQKIEGSLLTMPTLVWLNFNDAPLADVVQALRRQTAMKISLVPESSPRWKQERLSLQETQPLPFWKAVDRVCAAGALQYDLELRGLPSRNQLTLALTDRNTRPIHPISDHGPFRVSLVRLEFHRNVEFAAALPQARGNPGRAGLPVAKHELSPPKPRPVYSVQCSVQLQVTAEPRLAVSQTGALQILEARDDLGNSLRVDGPGTPVLTRNADYLGGSCTSVVHVGAPLNRPENPGQTIKILRGSVPLRITARQPDPLLVPLATAAGKAFESSDLRVLIHEVRVDPNTHQRQIELTVRETRSGGLPTSAEESVLDLGSRFDPHQQNIEIIDARGRVVPWVQTNIDMESSRITLTMAVPAGAEPKELRYYRLSETAVNVPFSFSDVPMP
jgi:hypothetical protein